MDFDDIGPGFEGAVEEKTAVNIIVINENITFELEMPKGDAGRQMYFRTIKRIVHPKFLGMSVDNRPHYRYDIDLDGAYPGTFEYELVDGGYTKTS